MDLLHDTYFFQSIYQNLIHLLIYFQKLLYSKILYLLKFQPQVLGKPKSSNLKSQLNQKIEIKELELKRINLKIDSVTKENESLFLKSLKFRPIYKDLNGSKTAQGYEKVACENRKVDDFILYLVDEEKGQFSEALNEKFDKFPLSDGYVIPKYDGLALDSLKIEACKKYAKFED